MTDPDMYSLFDPPGKVMPTTAFVIRHLPVVSRTVRTDYQLLLMKASGRGRNVNILIGCVLMNYYNNSFPT